MRLQKILLFLVCASLVAAILNIQGIPAHAAGITVTSPFLKDVNGSVITDVVSGDQVVLSTTVTNANSQDQPATIVLEVRTSNGVTVHLIWLSAKLHANDNFDIGLSWTPEESGGYEIRTFVLTDLKNPEILSEIKSSSIDVKPIRSEQPSKQQEPEEPSEISRVDDMFVLGDPSGNEYQVRFSLIDKNQAEIGADGAVTFTIEDGRGTALYEQKFILKKNDFQTYYLKLTGQNFLAYVWTIPVSEVEKGIGPYGKATVKFTDGNGKLFTASYSAVSIPNLSEQEIQQSYENDYIKSAKEVNKSLVKGGFEVTLVRFGNFKHLQYDTWGDEVTEFRADFAITNTGSSSEYTPSEFVILDGKGNQFDASYTGTLDYKELYPDATMRGYKTFEGFDGAIDTEKLIVTKSGYPSDTQWTFDLADLDKSSAAVKSAYSDSGSKKHDLAVNVEFAKDPIVRGNIQTITVEVTDDQTGEDISDASVKAWVVYASTSTTKSFIGHTDASGDVAFSWEIDGNSNTGTFNVDVTVNSDNYDTVISSRSFQVISAT